MKIRHYISLLALAGSLALPPAANASAVVRMETVEGNIDLKMLDESVPNTVENFISNYVDKGAYNNTFIHRTQSLVPNGIGIIQGGGFVWNDTASSIAKIPSLTTILSEIENSESNVRGTIAMALTGSDINSASNHWFINTVDNSQKLDVHLDPNTNTILGFTVFGRVLGDGMTVVDNLAALPVQDASTLPENDTLALQAPFDFSTNTVAQVLHGNFGSIPLIGYSSGPIQRQHVALISKVRVMVRGPMGSFGTPITLPGDKYAMLSLSQPDYFFGLGVVVDGFASVANPSPDDLPTGITFDQGFYSFTLSNVATDSISVVLSLPDDLPADQRPNTYYKYGKTPDNNLDHWYNFMYDPKTGTGAVINGNMIALVFVDGERGDDDLTKNHIIVDIGAPGVGPVVVNGGGGGGAVDLWSLLTGVLALGWKMRTRFITRFASQSGAAQ